MAKADTKDKKKIRKDHAISKTVAGVLIIAWGWYCLTRPSYWGLQYWGPTGIFFGAFLITSVIERCMLRNCLKSYEVILSNDPSGSISAIAGATKTSERVAMENLKLLVKQDLLPGAVVDEQARRVIRKSTDIQTVEELRSPKTSGSQGSAQTQGEAATVVVKCPGCGANNEVRVGSTLPCDHCGTLLNA